MQPLNYMKLHPQKTVTLTFTTVRTSDLNNFKIYYVYVNLFLPDCLIQHTALNIRPYKSGNGQYVKGIFLPNITLSKQQDADSKNIKIYILEVRGSISNKIPPTIRGF
jgi:hypothetical protein